MFVWLLLAACFDAPTTTAPPAAASDLQAEMLGRPLEITRHGACRMACREVDQQEALSVLREGTLIPERSRSDGACLSHAIEGKGTDGHRLRVVFAECPDETRLVTAIDLDEDWPCDCD